MTSILTTWQQAFSNKYRRSSKIHTAATFKALYTTQKPRIYVPIENQQKTVSKYLFPSCKLTSLKGEVFFYTLYYAVYILLILDMVH